MLARSARGEFADKRDHQNSKWRKTIHTGPDSANCDVTYAGKLRNNEVNIGSRFSISPDPS